MRHKLKIAILLFWSVAAHAQVDVGSFEKMQEKAAQLGRPFIATESLIKEGLPAVDQSVWTAVAGYMIVHPAGEDVEKIRKTGQLNETLVVKMMGPDSEQLRVIVNLGGAEKTPIVGRMSETCDIDIKDISVRSVLTTFASGGEISTVQECKLYAWVFAVYGLKFVESPDGKGLVLTSVDS